MGNQLGLHSNYMLNQGYAYTTVISNEGWNNGAVTLNGVTANGSESLTLGQTLILCKRWQYIRVHQVGSHMIPETSAHLITGSPYQHIRRCESVR